MLPRFLCALFLLLAGSPALAETSLKPLAVGLDWFLNPNHAPLVVALQRGYFAEEGLEVTLVAPSDTLDNVTMVLEGKAQIGMSDQVRSQIEVAEVSPLQIVGTLVPVPLNVVLAVKGGPVKAIADLRGKRIGYADSQKAQRALLQLSLAGHGIAIDEVTLVDVGFAMVPALLDGKVDALTDAYRNFEPIQVTLAGKEPLVFDIEAGPIPPYSELVYIAKRGSLDEDTINGFLRAVARGVRSLVEDPAGSWKLFVAYDPQMDTELNKRAWAASIPFFALRPESLDRQRYRRFATFLADHGLIDEVPAADAYLFGQ